MSEGKGVLTAGETAGMLGVSERDVYSLCASGVLPHYICFDRDAVMEMKGKIESFLKTGSDYENRR
jgi:hypothetical protein